MLHLCKDRQYFHQSPRRKYPSGLVFIQWHIEYECIWLSTGENSPLDRCFWSSGGVCVCWGQEKEGQKDIFLLFTRNPRRFPIFLGGGGICYTTIIWKAECNVVCDPGEEFQPETPVSILWKNLMLTKDDKVRQIWVTKGWQARRGVGQFP